MAFPFCGAVRDDIDGTGRKPVPFAAGKREVQRMLKAALPLQMGQNRRLASSHT